MYIYYLLTWTISVSPAFQLEIKVPVRDSNNEITPLVNPTAIKVSLGLIHTVFIVPADAGVLFHGCKRLCDLMSKNL